MEREEEGGFLPLAYKLVQMVPVRKNFSKADLAFINAYGHFPINRMTVCRTPISNIVNKGLNLITVGLWEKAVAKYGYDNMFHLFLLIDIIDTSKGGKIVTAILEKHDTPRCHEYKEAGSPDTETIFVQKHFSGTLRSALEATIAQMGDSFWVYTGFQNNCQDFLIQFLGANGLLTPPVATFIKQDVESIANELPVWTRPAANYITNTIRKVRTLFGGELSPSTSNLN